MRWSHKFILMLCCLHTATMAWAMSEPTDTASRLAKGVELGDVVVYGSSSNFGVHSSQMSAVSIDQRQIMAAPMFFGETDVLKSIQKMPGVQSEAEGSAGIYVRGGAYDQNYITLDGSPIYNAEHMRGYVSAINPDMVQSVNFYRGAFPARYGSRLSSVVDIGIREGDFNHYHGTLSLGVLSSRAQAEGPLWRGHTSLNVGVRMSYFDLIARPVMKHFYDRPEALQPYANMDYYDITAKLVHKFNERNRLTAVVYYGKDQDKESPSESSYDVNFLENNDCFWEDQYHQYGNLRSKQTKSWSNLLMSLYYTTILRPEHRLNINVSYSGYTYNREMAKSSNDYIVDHIRLWRSVEAAYSQKSTSNVKDLSLTADATLRLGPSHTLRYGLKATHQWFEPKEIVYKKINSKQFGQSLNWNGTLIGDEDNYYNTHEELVDYTSNENMSVNNATIYGEDDWDVTSRIKLNYGLRAGLYAVTGKTYFAIEPRVSARYLITPQLSAKLSYSRMTQATHRLVSNNLITPSDVWVPITKDFPMMKSDMAAVGLNYDWHGINISAEAYYKTLSDVLEYRNGATYYINNQNWRNIVAQGDGRSYGFELMAERKAGRTTGWLSYTWSKALRKFDRDGQEINGGQEFYASSDHRNNISANVSHNIQLSQSWEMNLSASWTYQTGRRGTMAHSIVYGQSMREYVSRDKIFSHSAGTSTEINYSLVPHAEDMYDITLSDALLAQEFHTFRNVNDFKLPDVHHLDINVNFTFKYGIFNTLIDIGCYNVYNHYNISNVYVAYNGSKTVLKGICPFPIMPSISITQKF